MNNPLIFSQYYIMGGFFMGKINKEKITPELRLKYEIATELDLMDKVMKFGWGGLTAKETGRIGGIMTARKKSKKP